MSDPINTDVFEEPVATADLETNFDTFDQSDDFNTFDLSDDFNTFEESNDFDCEYDSDEDKKLHTDQESKELNEFRQQMINEVKLKKLEYKISEGMNMISKYNKEAQELQSKSETAQFNIDQIHCKMFSFDTFDEMD